MSNVAHNMERGTARRSLPAYTTYNYWDVELICLQLPVIITCALGYLNYGIGGRPLLAFAILHTVFVIYQYHFIRKSGAALIAARVSPDVWHEIPPPLITGLLMVLGSGTAWVLVTASRLEMTTQARLALLLSGRYLSVSDTPALGIMCIAVTSSFIVGFCCFFAGIANAIDYAVHRMLGFTVAQPVSQSEKQSHEALPEPIEQDNVRDSLDWINSIVNVAFVLPVCIVIANMYIKDAVLRQVLPSLAMLLGETFGFLLGARRHRSAKWTIVTLKWLIVITSAGIMTWAMHGMKF